MSPEDIVAMEWRRVLGESVTEDLVARLAFDALEALARTGWSVVQLEQPDRDVPLYRVAVGAVACRPGS